VIDVPARVFDEMIERDAKAGKLDELAARRRRRRRNGRASGSRDARIQNNNLEGSGLKRHLHGVGRTEGRGMFEKALITRVGDLGVDLGTLAETILFYGSTHLLLNRGSVISLAKRLPSDDLLALLDRGEVRLSYLRPSYAVATTGPFGVHKFVAVTLHGNKNDGRGAEILDHREEIRDALKRALGDSQSTRRLAKQIGDRLSLHRFKNVPDGENVIVKLAEQDIHDPSFLRSAARVVLENHLPQDAVPQSFRFGMIDTGTGYLIDTDLNYQNLNAIYHLRVPPSHSSLSDALLLGYVVNSRLESYFAAEYMAELATIPLQSRLIRIKQYEFLRARDKSTSTIELFKEIALNDFPLIREAINSGDRSITDFLKLLDQAEKFRSWLGRENPDSELLANYVRVATGQTWADRLPTKTVRWAVATGIGLAVDAALPTGLGTAAGVSVGALDAFYLDRFIKGWRPSHFIEGPYKEFVSARRS
jgi:hypothetical protein